MRTSLSVCRIREEFRKTIPEYDFLAMEERARLEKWAVWPEERNELHERGKWLGRHKFKNYLRDRSSADVFADIFTLLISCLRVSSRCLQRVKNNWYDALLLAANEKQ